jgi:hypothetical protein
MLSALRSSPAAAGRPRPQRGHRGASAAAPRSRSRAPFACHAAKGFGSSAGKGFSGATKKAAASKAPELDDSCLCGSGKAYKVRGASRSPPDRRPEPLRALAP